MVHLKRQWTRMSGSATLLAAVNCAVSCSSAEQNNLRDKGKSIEVAQGPGTSESDDDFTVAQPVPMALLDPTFLADNKDQFDQSGAGGSYNDSKANDCATQINPMDTTEDEYDIPKNFCISFNIMSVPGYAAGEMKHGPLALIDENMAVVMLVPNDEMYEKSLSNLEEAKARGGQIISIGTGTNARLQEISIHYLQLPEVGWFTLPLLEAIPVQLLAYHVASSLGHDVDQPRNLAKSVTVE